MTHRWINLDNLTRCAAAPECTAYAPTREIERRTTDGDWLCDDHWPTHARVCAGCGDRVVRTALDKSGRCLDCREDATGMGV